MRFGAVDVRPMGIRSSRVTLLLRLLVMIASADDAVVAFAIIPALHFSVGEARSDG